MKARLKWIENAAFLGVSDSGHGITIDGSESIGGQNLGLRPMELMLLGAGGCSAMDVISILKKSRQAVTDCTVELSASRADSIPGVFTAIHLKFVVAGVGLSESRVARAIDLSAHKYCSATAMLRDTVAITHEFEIVETGRGSG